MGAVNPDIELFQPIPKEFCLTKAKMYDLQGIVLIDEIETHLHVELQKKILPFLTNFFPNIQFVITTHSPFILNYHCIYLLMALSLIFFLHRGL